MKLNHPILHLHTHKQADAKSSSDAKTARGAKGAKGSRTAAAAAATGGGVEASAAVAKGKFSVDASADVKRSRKGSGFKMADAKALTRALAKGVMRVPPQFCWHIPRTTLCGVQCEIRVCVWTDSSSRRVFDCTGSRLMKCQVQND